MKVIGGLGLLRPRLLRRPTAEQRFLGQLDLGGRVVYDVGADDGVLTLFFANRVRPDGVVVAFEPHPESYHRIAEHVQLNELANVIVRNVAVGEASGERGFTYPIDRGYGSAEPGIKAKLEAIGGTRDLRLPVIALDDEIAGHSLPEPDFVKVDVEGMELEVLAGMRTLVTTRKPEVFIELHGASSEAKRTNASAVLNFLFEHRYEIFHVETGHWVRNPSGDGVCEGHLYGL
jgi:FkbM family methyltransferase